MQCSQVAFRRARCLMVRVELQNVSVGCRYAINLDVTATAEILGRHEHHAFPRAVECESPWLKISREVVRQAVSIFPPARGLSAASPIV